MEQKWCLFVWDNKSATWVICLHSDNRNNIMLFNTIAEIDDYLQVVLQEVAVIKIDKVYIRRQNDPY